MVCPMCIIDGAIIASCRFFGVPDVVTTFLLGILTLSLAIVTLRWIKEKLLLEKTYRGSLVFITAVYSTLTILAMRLVGMF